MAPWGNKDYQMHVGFVIRECRSCGKQSPFSVLKNENKLTFCTMPTLALSTKRWIQCQDCHDLLEVTARDWEAIAPNLMSRDRLSEMLRDAAVQARHAHDPTPDVLQSNDGLLANPVPSWLFSAGTFGMHRFDDAIADIVSKKHLDRDSTAARARFAASAFAVVWTGILASWPEIRAKQLIAQQQDLLFERAPKWGWRASRETIVGSVDYLMREFDVHSENGGMKVLHMANAILRQFIPEEEMAVSKSMQIVAIIGEVLEKVRGIAGAEVEDVSAAQAAKNVSVVIAARLEDALLGVMKLAKDNNAEISERAAAINMITALYVIAAEAASRELGVGPGFAEFQEILEMRLARYLERLRAVEPAKIVARAFDVQSEILRDAIQKYDTFESGASAAFVECVSHQKPRDDDKVTEALRIVAPFLQDVVNETRGKRIAIEVEND